MSNINLSYLTIIDCEFPFFLFFLGHIHIAVHVIQKKHFVTNTDWFTFATLMNVHRIFFSSTGVLNTFDGNAYVYCFTPFSYTKTSSPLAILKRLVNNNFIMIEWMISHDSEFESKSDTYKKSHNCTIFPILLKCLA